MHNLYILQVSKFITYYNINKSFNNQIKNKGKI